MSGQLKRYIGDLRLRRQWRTAVLVGACSIVVGCGGINLVETGPPPSFYDLGLNPNVTELSGRYSWQLVVEEPSATAAVDTDRIMVRPSKFEVQYYAGSRWTDRVPLLVQTGLIEAYERTGAVTATRQAIGLRGDYMLKSDIREFSAHIEPEGRPPKIEIRINFKLINRVDANIIASKTVAVTEVAQSREIVSVASAFQDGGNELLEEIVLWSIEEASRDFEARATNLGR